MTEAYTLARAAVPQLEAAGSDAPQLEAELLMAEVLGFSRAALLARWRDYILTVEEQQRWQAMLQRRLAGEPLAYILGRREFYGISLKTDARALIPRPETEMLVEAALRWCKSHPMMHVADIGTGSGAIAIALASHLPQHVQVLATDISAAALSLARENAKMVGVAGRITFYQGDLAAPLPVQVGCIVANLPYIDDTGMADLALQISSYEPHMALYGGSNGLALYRRLFKQISHGKCLQPDGALFCEIASNHGQQALELARCLFPSAEWQLATDFSGQPRMLYSECVP